AALARDLEAQARCTDCFEVCAARDEAHIDARPGKLYADVPADGARTVNADLHDTASPARGSRTAYMTMRGEALPSRAELRKHDRMRQRFRRRRGCATPLDLI